MGTKRVEMADQPGVHGLGLPSASEGDGEAHLHRRSIHSSAMEEKSAKPTGQPEFIATCKQLLDEIDSVCLQLKTVTDQSENKDDKRIKMMEDFGKAWQSSKSIILKNWNQIESNYSVLDPMCTSPSHIESNSNICNFQTSTLAILNAKETIEMIRNEVFALKLPVPKAQSYDNLWEDSYFFKNWGNLLNYALVHNQAEIKNAENVPGLLPFAYHWTEYGYILWALWCQGCSIDFDFHGQIPENCFYLKVYVKVKANTTAARPIKESVEEDMETETAPTSKEQHETPTKSGEAQNATKSEGALEAASTAGKPETVPKAKFETLQQNRDELKQQVDQYSVMYAELQQQLNDLKHQHHEQCRVNAELTEKQIRLQEELENLWRSSDYQSKLESSCKQLKNQNEKYKGENASLKQDLGNLRAEFGKLVHTNEQHQKACQDYKKHYENENAQVRRLDTELRHAHEDRKRLHGEIRELRAEKESLLNNMSSLMNQQMSRDESDLENINVKNRPMKILDDYSLFVSQEWLDAKTAVDEWLDEKHIEPEENEICTQITTSMLKCYEFAQKLHTAQQEHIANIISDPLHQTILEYVESSFVTEAPKDVEGSGEQEHTTGRKPRGGGKPKKKSKPLDDDFKFLIAKSMKSSSDNVDFGEISKKIAAEHFKEIMGCTTDDKLQQHSDLVSFCEKCLVMCWKMVLQQPPMSFQCEPGPGEEFVDNKHELHFGSADPSKPNVVIHYYVHPALFHGEKQMKKARVVLHAKQEEKPPEEPKDEGIDRGGQAEIAEEAVEETPPGGAKAAWADESSTPPHGPHSNPNAHGSHKERNMHKDAGRANENSDVHVVDIMNDVD